MVKKARGGVPCQLGGGVFWVFGVYSERGQNRGFRVFRVFRVFADLAGSGPQFRGGRVSGWWVSAGSVSSVSGGSSNGWWVPAGEFWLGQKRFRDRAESGGWSPLTLSWQSSSVTEYAYVLFLSLASAVADLAVRVAEVSTLFANNR